METIEEKLGASESRYRGIDDESCFAIPKPAIIASYSASLLEIENLYHVFDGVSFEECRGTVHMQLLVSVGDLFPNDSQGRIDIFTHLYRHRVMLGDAWRVCFYAGRSAFNNNSVKAWPFTTVRWTNSMLELA
ncbi:hypothetical protein ACLOJK_021147 [Asimina triloba]